MPNNQAENDFFEDLGRLSSGQRIWLGISDEETEGVWKNVNTGLCQNII